LHGITGVAYFSSIHQKWQTIGSQPWSLIMRLKAADGIVESATRRSSWKDPGRWAAMFWSVILLGLGLAGACGQSTAFTYQGQLAAGGSPANGKYDFTFAIFDGCTNGNQEGLVLTNLATTVSNGLFSAGLDFGNQYPGADRWLEIAVCTNGAGTFVKLAPRQLLAPVPYAVTAHTIIPGGLPAGTYTNAIVFSNAGNQFFGNAAGMTNLAFASLSAAAQAQLTNTVAGALAGTQSNLTALATAAVDTNLFGLLSSQSLLVAPYTNLPSYLLTNPYYFSPAKGCDYIQQAINALPTYPDKQHVGGGSITVVGINYFPSTLVFANGGFNSNIMTFKLSAPAFTLAALVCQTNPCVHVFGYGNGGYGSETAFAMDNLIIASLQNTPAVLFNMDVNVTDSEVEHCWFGYWPYLTNQMVVNQPQGLATPNTEEGINKNNLVVMYTPGSTDRHVFNYNHLTGIDCLFVDCDHFQCDFNFFMECGGNAGLGMRSTDWPVAAAVAEPTLDAESTTFWTGAAVVFGQDQPHRNYTFTDNYFYYCGGAYYSPWPQGNFYSYQDSYEQTLFSSLTPAGDSFHMIDSDAGADSLTLTSATTWSQDAGTMRGALWLDSGSFPFTQNGSSLTNLSAAHVTGTLPAACLPGITTNVSTGAVTLYITNGLVMKVTSP
jgi:hypothetical protein